VGEVSGYGYDREFNVELREASLEASAIRAWAEEWILGNGWEGYLAQLGDERLRQLSSQTWPPTSQRDAIDRTPVAREMADQRTADRERLVVWAARELAERAAAGDHEVLFGGIGVSNLASWVYRELWDLAGREALPMLVESGTYDFDPPRNDGYIFTPRALPTAKLVDGTEFGLGLVMSTARTLSILTGAVIDRQGNVNSSRLGGRHFVGCGGANDAMTNADEVILAVDATPNRLVDEVEFVTGPGSTSRPSSPNKAPSASTTASCGLPRSTCHRARPARSDWTPSRPLSAGTSRSPRRWRSDAGTRPTRS